MSPFVTDLATLEPEVRDAVLSRLSVEEKAAYLYAWGAWARPNQLPPAGDWRVWLLLSGRGYGKTRSGAEWVRGQVEDGHRKRIALVAPTAGDTRDTMVEGESGILAVSRPSFHPVYEPSKRRLTWPNGAIATMYSADRPDRLRGPQHDAAWCDELASWRYPEAWDMLLFGLRLGVNPQAVVTTTPRPTRLIKGLLAKDSTVSTRGTTYENAANLAPGFYEDIVAAYEGTNLGRQEIYGEVIEDIAGALWRREWLDDLRVTPDKVPDLARVVVAIDPAVTSLPGSDETGIVVVGCDDGDPVQGYVLDDLSGRYKPEEWASIAIRAYHKHKADRIIGEANNGGDLIESVIRTIEPGVSYRKVHASRGKYVRAEPVSTLYQKGRAHHVGLFGVLEDQMCLPADVLVTTARGQVPITHVTTDDHVMTRKGWRSVLWSGQTGVAPTIGVRTKDGYTLRGTVGHPVYVTGRGFVPLGEVQTSDTLARCHDLSSESASSSVGNATTGTTMATSRRRGPVVVGFSIVTSGRRLMARFLRVMSSTIGTGTGGTTPSPTLRPCLVGPTTGATGTRVGSMQSGRPLSPPSAPVPVVGPSGHGDDTSRTAPSVVLARLPQRGPEPVFNLCVQGEHEFFANGLLVHNCNMTPDMDRRIMGSPDRVDALVWGFWALMVGRRGFGKPPAQSRTAL